MNGRANSYVYQHIRLDTKEIFYVGIGTGRNFYRSREKARRNSHWTRIVEKYGYLIEIVIANISFEDACVIEKELIQQIGRVDLGKGTLVNLTDGGDGTIGTIVKEETKVKLSAVWSGRKRSQSDKDKKSVSGKNGWEKRRKEGKVVSCNKKVVCLNNNKEYNSGREAASELGLSIGNVSMVVNGIRKHTKGYKFKYAA